MLTIIFALLASPAFASTSYPKNVELVFVIDTTSSMGGLIEGAKQKVWSVINEVQQSENKPKIKVGLVAYRDHGDEYVTKVFPLTANLDDIYSQLMKLRAEGGGDEPEDVRQGLADGVHKAGWSERNKDLRQILFLVGDAAPHDDYTQEPDTVTSTKEAIAKGIIVNAIQCGTSDSAMKSWKAIAMAGEGRYFSIQQNGGVASITTPYDSRLAELGGKIGATYIAYGTGGAAKAARQASSDSFMASAAPMAAQAERAVNKAINSEAYDSDLVQMLDEGTVKEESVDTNSLPGELKNLAPEKRKEAIHERVTGRKKMQAEILGLSRKRDQFLEDARKKTGAAKDGFDVAVAEALKEQLSKKR